MPRLPDVQSLGARPIAGPQRQIVGFDTPSIGQAEATALDLSPVGGVLSNQAERMFRRQDALDRLDKRKLYEAEVADELRSLQSSGDLSQNATIAAYGKMLSKRRTELLSEHRGSADSRAALDAELSDIRSRYAGEIAAQSAVAQRAKVRGERDSVINTMAARAGQDPGSASSLIVELDRRLDTLADAMTPEDDAEARRVGRALVLATSAETLLDRGDVEGARLALADPEAAALIPADTMRRLQSRASDQARSESSLETRIAEVEGVLGRQLNQAERAQLIGLSPQSVPGAETMQRIAIAEQVLGRSLTEQEQLTALELAPKTPLVSIQGDIPTPEEGLQNVFDEQGRLIRQEPVEGSSIALERESAQQAAEAKRQQVSEQATTQIRAIDSAMALIQERGAGGPIEGSFPDVISTVFAPSTLALQGVIKQVKSAVMRETLEDMRASSSSGASGFGAMNQAELESAEIAQGLLDIRLPERTLENLKVIREAQLDAIFGSDEEHERAIEDGILTPEGAQDLKRQRQTIGFDILGRPQQQQAAAPSEAAGKPIAEMSETELQDLALDSARLQSLSQQEYDALAARLRGAAGGQ